ncbi:MAG: TIGR03668 family PPOX class F420-dependent oxidoreductase [Acidimicrobiia bacterium]|nr:TIGR03668 family PPOX class F420-dependent oxidoreductase [Acidimicrobiia bacterium]
MNPSEALDRLAAARVARLATVDADGVPHLVPLVYAVDDRRIFSAVDHKPKRSQRLKRLANITVNPAVALLADEYSDDWSKLWWVRVDGSAKLIETGDEWEGAVELLANKYRQYRGQPPTGAVIEIAIDRISGWSAAT